MNYVSRKLFILCLICDAGNGFTTPFKLSTVSANPTEQTSEFLPLKFPTTPTSSRFSDIPPTAYVPETMNFISTASVLNLDTTFSKMDPVLSMTTSLPSALPNTSTLKPHINPLFSSTLSLSNTIDYILHSTLASLDLNTYPTPLITPSENYKSSKFTDTQKLSTSLSYSLLLTTNPPTQLTGSSVPLTVLPQPILTKSLKSNKKPLARQYAASRTQSLNPITFTLNSLASTMIQQIYWLRYFFG